MKKKFIKRAIPAEISGKGGGYIQFVEKDTVPLDGVIVDAIDGSYFQGRPTLILAAIQGLLKSMARGVATDGHPRQVADYITVYLVVDGEIDLDRGFDPAVNSLKIRARLLNEMEIDITGWALEDVTPGRRSFTLASAYTGATKGAWEIGEAGEINGDNVPNTKTGEAIRVDWKVEGTDRSGTIPADKVTSNISRIDIAADALAEVTMHEDVILDGTRLKGFERLVARHEEYAGEIELPTEGVTASDDGTQLALPGSVWDAITAKVDPSMMPTRPITFEVITPEGSASISPTVP